ncbi:MAG: hypothetical protein QOH50_4977 [Kribbellaceae bacterium]|nr:hypothetical protein [Kribbellaceae bacterium]
MAYKYIHNLGMVVGLMPTGMPVGKYIQNLGMAVGLMAIGMPVDKYIQNFGIKSAPTW